MPKSRQAWLRSALAIPLCVLAFNATHAAGAMLSPRAYEALVLDSQRIMLLGYITLAGIAATFVLVAVAGHRAWLHVSVLLAVGLAIDVGAIFGELAGQPLWFRGLVIALLPVQALTGMALGRMMWTLGPRSRHGTRDG